MAAVLRPNKARCCLGIASVFGIQYRSIRYSCRGIRYSAWPGSPGCACYCARNARQLQRPFANANTICQCKHTDRNCLPQQLLHWHADTSSDVVLQALQCSSIQQAPANGQGTSMLAYPIFFNVSNASPDPFHPFGAGFVISMQVRCHPASVCLHSAVKFCPRFAPQCLRRSASFTPRVAAVQNPCRNITGHTPNIMRSRTGIFSKELTMKGSHVSVPSPFVQQSVSLRGILATLSLH